jgi:AAA domain-containing protein
MGFAATAKWEHTFGIEEFAEHLRTTTAPTKHGLPLVKLARFGDRSTAQGSLRHDGNLVAITGAEADYDGGAVSFDRAVEIAAWGNLSCVVEETASSTPDRPRWRVWCPTSTELAPRERDRLIDRLNGLFGGVLGAESWTLSQSFFCGRALDNPLNAHRVELIDGEPIDLLDDLDLIARGKPHTGSTNGAGYAGPVDEAALIEEIISGHSYHPASLRLLGTWARRGVSMVEAEERLRAKFEAVFPPDRDERWHQRYGEIPKLVDFVYGKEAEARDNRIEFVIGGNGAEAAADQPEQEQPQSQEQEGEPPLCALSQAELRALDIPPSDFVLGRVFSTTTRGVVVGKTGIGKTNVLMGIAQAKADGKPFLHWAAGRPTRVLYIDGELSLRLLQERSNDAARRAGGEDSHNLFLLSHARAEDAMPPLNTPRGQRFVRCLEAVGLGRREMSERQTDHAGRQSG